MGTETSQMAHCGPIAEGNSSGGGLVSARVGPRGSLLMICDVFFVLNARSRNLLGFWLAKTTATRIKDRTNDETHSMNHFSGPLTAFKRAAAAFIVVQQHPARSQAQTVHGTHQAYTTLNRPGSVCWPTHMQMQQQQRRINPGTHDNQAAALRKQGENWHFLPQCQGMTTDNRPSTEHTQPQRPRARNKGTPNLRRHACTESALLPRGLPPRCCRSIERTDVGLNERRGPVIP